MSVKILGRHWKWYIQCTLVPLKGCGVKVRPSSAAVQFFSVAYVLHIHNIMHMFSHTDSQYCVSAFRCQDKIYVHLESRPQNKMAGP